MFFGTLIFLDRDERANGLLLTAVGIIWQLPVPEIVEFDTPVWMMFLVDLASPLPWIVISVVLLRFPERRLKKRYERIFMIVMTTWLLGFSTIHAVSLPCWSPKRTVVAVDWPLWLVNCQLSDVAFFAGTRGQMIFASGVIVLLALRIFRTYGLDRRVYVPVHIASIVGMGAGVYMLVDAFQADFTGVYSLPQFYKGFCVVITVIPVMLFLGNFGRRLMQLRIAGMVAQINLARTPDGIQAALRRALDDPSLEIHLWSRERELM
jgi:hypothetical protein